MADRKEDLFTQGIRAFNEGNYYDAHEFWEDLWSDYYFSDRLYVQGLIQMSVGYYHITNQNLKGAKGLFNKCVPKLEKFQNNETRGLNLADLIQSVRNSYDCVSRIEDTTQFDWSLAPKINRKVDDC
tara:strand:+ start:1732 stop:2112 length:381 start_codon:yes stop_codon:yes gene_type:complete